MEQVPRLGSPSRSSLPASRGPLLSPRSASLSTGSAPIAPPPVPLGEGSVPSHESGSSSSSQQPRRLPKLMTLAQLLEKKAALKAILERQDILLNRSVAHLQAAVKGNVQRIAARKLVWPITNIIKSMEASGISKPSPAQIEEFLSALARNERDPLMQQQIADARARLGHPNITLGLAQYHGDKARGIDVGAALYREAELKAVYAEQSRAKKVALAEGKRDKEY